MLDFDIDKNCYGCGVCVEICPFHAIKMITDHEGFQIPHITQSLCKECGLCERKCPFLSQFPSETRLKNALCEAAFRKDLKERFKSASGGIAAVIAEYFVKRGGTVIGCAWTKDLEAKHIPVNSTKDVHLLQGSKYVQSDMRESYRNVKECIQNNKECLFIGTPCQVGAIRNVFGNEKNLYTIGLICGGVGSPKVWKRFKEEMEKKFASPMVSANFRSKSRYGWNTPVALYEFKNGKKSEKLSFQTDPFVLQYLYGMFKRKSCYQCTYKGDSINADLILGDYWGSSKFRKLSKNMGISAIICKSKKGEWMASLVNDECEVMKTTIEDILKRNQPLISSTSFLGNREEFFRSLDQEGYSTAAERWGGRINPVKAVLINVMDRMRVFELIKEVIKG